MSEVFDAIVVGAGHNGLTAAVVLQRAGMRTLSPEANIMSVNIRGAQRAGDGLPQRSDANDGAPQRETWHGRRHGHGRVGCLEHRAG